MTVNYAANGQKTKKTSPDETRSYVEGIEYKNGTIDVIHHSEGRIVYKNGTAQVEYVIRDHLGNTRVTFTDRNGDGHIDPKASGGELLQENHYYPFGLNIQNPDYAATADPENSYQYNGKELMTDLNLGWSDFGFRWYDPVICRFTGVDPIAEKFSWVSVYNYAENSPITFIDLWGLQKAHYSYVGGTGGSIPIRGNQFTDEDRTKMTNTALNITPIVGDIKGGIEVVTNKDMVTGEKIGGLRWLGVLGLSEFKGALKFMGSGLKKLFQNSDNVNSGLGDLTKSEVSQIQDVVDEAGRPLEVVGSAAKAERRNPGSDLPVGKGPGTKSDIDYTTANANRDNFNGLEGNLPSPDPETPILRGSGDASQGPVIRFEPGNQPTKVEEN